MPYNGRAGVSLALTKRCGPARMRRCGRERAMRPWPVRRREAGGRMSASRGEEGARDGQRRFPARRPPRASADGDTDRRLRCRGGVRRVHDHEAYPRCPRGESRQGAGLLRQRAVGLRQDLHLVCVHGRRRRQTGADRPGVCGESRIPRRSQVGHRADDVGKRRHGHGRAGERIMRRGYGGRGSRRSRRRARPGRQPDDQPHDYRAVSGRHRQAEHRGQAQQRFAQPDRGAAARRHAGDVS